MLLGALFRILRVPRLWARILLRRDWIGFTRLHFLVSALDAGLLAALDRGASLDELAREIGIRDRELLASFLAVGVALGEIAERDGRYRLRGARARALRADDTTAALIEEWVHYRGDVYRQLPRRLRGAPPGDYLERFGRVIARSSRIVEPFVAHFARELVRGRPGTILDVGCGSGVYLRHAAEADPSVRGLGIDSDASVVAEARANLDTWGLATRFAVLQADIRQPPPEAAGPFGLITLFNNVYYFDPRERAALFASLRSRLSFGGTLAIVVLVRGRMVDAIDLDLVLRSTAGNTPLPMRDELEVQLREAGFAAIRSRLLAPLLCGVTASS